MIPSVSDLSERQHVVGLSLTQLALRRLRRDYLTIAALVVLLLMTALAVLAPVISDLLNVDPTTPGGVEDQLLSIGAEGHLLGTDVVGRDHLSRLLYGGRVSLGIAFASALLSLGVGTSLGLITGYYQGTALGWIDDLMTWFVTTLNSIPSLYMLILLAAFLRPNETTLILVLSLYSWTFTMRLVRGQTLSLREAEYIVAARAMGSGPLRNMFTHILPNVFSVLVIDLASNIGSLILVESSLSYLNLGVRDPTPSWGNMLSNAQSLFRTGPHLVILPGALIVITVLCLYLIGDGLRDAFDPQASKKNV
jgi:peptide/nickel transport system permease protein